MVSAKSPWGYCAFWRKATNRWKNANFTISESTLHMKYGSMPLRDTFSLPFEISHPPWPSDVSYSHVKMQFKTKEISAILSSLSQRKSDLCVLSWTAFYLFFFFHSHMIILCPMLQKLLYLTYQISTMQNINSIEFLLTLMTHN